MSRSLAATLDPAPERPVLEALRDLRGRATVADVIARTGLATRDAEASLRRLLEVRRGHLEVADDGTLVYAFEPDLERRDAEPFWSRFKRKAWSLFKKAFKVWIVVMLVVYFVVFVALLVAAIVASQNRDEGGGGWGGNRRGHGHHGHGLGNLFFWYWFWSPGWRHRPYYGHRYPGYGSSGRRGERRPEDRVPFYKKVFAFVFGPDVPEPTREQKDRSVVRLIRARKGVVTTAELMQHTGLTRPEAEDEMGRLIAAYDGEPRVSVGGEIVYVFPDLMVSAHGRVRAREPDPAWRRLEARRVLTGNDVGTNILVGGLNAFNLVAAATAPLFIFPRLGLGGTAAWVGLVWVPLAFSATFFSVPLARAWSVTRENARRAARNVRKVVMGYVYRDALVGDGAQPVRAPELVTKVAEVLRDEDADPARVEATLHELAAEFDADVDTDAAGVFEFRFPEIRDEYMAAEGIRRELALEDREMGEIVYSSADTPAEAGERDLATFDRALAEGEAGGGQAPEDADLSRYIEAPDRVGYVEDWELVAFEEEMRQRGVAVGRG